MMAMSVSESSGYFAVAHWQTCGGGYNRIEKYWWGFTRWACDCEVKELVAKVEAAGITSGVITAAGFATCGGTAIFGACTTGWIALYISRLNYNNAKHGNTGIKIEMTHALVYDIKEQD